jgi:hypothetical protein
MLQKELELALKGYDRKHPDGLERRNSKGELVQETACVRIAMLKSYLKSSWNDQNAFFQLSNFYDYVNRSYFKPNSNQHVNAREIFSNDFLNSNSDSAAIFKRLREADELFTSLKTPKIPNIELAEPKVTVFFENVSATKPDEDKEPPAPETQASP